MKHGTYNNPDAFMYDALASAQHTDVYHAIATYRAPYIDVPTGTGTIKRKTRIRDNVLGAACFIVDIDVKPTGDAYRTKAEAAKAITNASKSIGIPTPTLVDSGYGIHGYWFVDAVVDPDTWVRHAMMLKQIFVSLGVMADPTRTADLMSVLRTPGTLNHKHGTTAPVRILFDGGVSTVDNITSAIAAKHHSLGLQEQTLTRQSATKVSAITAAMGVELPTVDADIEKIAAGCAVIGRCVQSRGNVPEPDWYAMLDILRFCTDGESLAHTYSAGHPGYTHAETAAKFNQIRSVGTGPRTCASISAGNSACASCPHRGKITTPLQLGKVREVVVLPPASADVLSAPPSFLAPQQPAQPVDSVLAIPFPYIRSTDSKGVVGIYTQEEGADGTPAEPKLIVPYDLTVVARYHDAVSLGDVLVFRVLLPHDGARDIEIQASDMADTRRAASVLAANGIYLKDYTGVLTYMSAYARHIQKASAASPLISRMGWSDDMTSFTIGSDVLTVANGTVTTLQGRVHTGVKREVDHYQSVGDLDTWRTAFDMYNVPGMEAYAFSALASFGAPLLVYAEGVNSVVLSLFGRTGQGKSTLMRVANSVWGEPSVNGIRERDTANAKEAKLGVIRNLPVMYDESTNADAEQIAAFCLQITGGRSKDGMTKANSFRSAVYEWRTILFTSTNWSWAGKLTSAKNNAEAEAMRVFEIELSHKSNTLLTKQQADVATTILRDNHGLAGRIFMSYVLSNSERVNAMVQAAIAFVEKATGSSSQERYWIALVACTLVGARIAKALGLHSYDTDAVASFGIAHIKRSREDVHSTHASPEEIVSMFLNQNINNTLVVRRAPGGAGTVTDGIPKGGAIYVRIEEDTGCIFVDRTAMERFCTISGVDAAAVRKGLRASGMLLDASAKKGLGHGTPAIGIVRTWKLDAKHPALTGLPAIIQAAQQTKTA